MPASRVGPGRSRPRRRGERRDGPAPIRPLPCSELAVAGLYFRASGAEAAMVGRRHRRGGARPRPRGRCVAGAWAALRSSSGLFRRPCSGAARQPAPASRRRPWRACWRPRRARAGACPCLRQRSLPVGACSARPCPRGGVHGDPGPSVRDSVGGSFVALLPPPADAHEHAVVLGESWRPAGGGAEPQREGDGRFVGPRHVGRYRTSATPTIFGGARGIRQSGEMAGGIPDAAAAFFPLSVSWRTGWRMPLRIALLGYLPVSDYQLQRIALLFLLLEHYKAILSLLTVPSCVFEVRGEQQLKV